MSHQQYEHSFTQCCKIKALCGTTTVKYLVMVPRPFPVSFFFTYKLAHWVSSTDTPVMHEDFVPFTDNGILLNCGDN